MSVVDRCSIADAMSVLGGRWAVHVLRDLVYGRHRFSDILASTGAPRDVLTTRLRELERAGLVRRQQYSAHPPRDEYHLTPAGEELAPVLLLLADWGDRWGAHADLPGPVEFRHDDHHLTPRLACGTCGQVVTAGHVAARSTLGLWDGDLALRGRHGPHEPL